MKLLCFAFLLFFVFFGSIYGFFASDIRILGFLLTGWQKNLLCSLGLLFIGVVAVYPILSIVYKALLNGPPDK